jgi:nitroreductase
MNIQAVDLYVVLEEGIYLWDPIKNELQPVVAGDHRKAAGGQPFVAVAAVNLVYVVDMEKYKGQAGHAMKASKEDKLKWAYMAAGLQSQNVNLYCASEGLGAVVRGSIDGPAFAKLAGFRPEQTVLSAQTVGVPGGEKAKQGGRRSGD